MNTPVSFYNAKLIKEKVGTELFSGNMAGFIMNKPEVINLPTIAEVVMWLYEKYGIWIFVGIEPESGIFYPNIDIKAGEHYYDKFDDYSSPTEAYEAGIEYTLKNLIP